MRRAVFLDRDGVINRAVVRDGKPYPPANLAAMEILPGVPDALAALHDAGFMLIVVTNPMWPEALHQWQLLRRSTITFTVACRLMSFVPVITIAAMVVIVANRYQVR